MLSNKIFDDAVRDISSIPLDGKGYQGRLVKGVKIVQDNKTKEVTIYNTSLGGDFYQEINKGQYKIFETNGWGEGVKNVQISNIRRILKSLNRLLVVEESTTRNTRRIKSFQNKIKKLNYELQRLIGGKDRPPYREER